MIRVLLVDDSKLTHRFLEEALAGQGFMVSGHAYDGLEAVRNYLETAPDVVIMDLMMPKLDGIGAIKEIRAIDPDARIIVLTTVDEEQMLRAAIDAGARDYTLKPCNPKRLVEALRRAAVGRTNRSRSSLRLSQALVEVIAAVLPEFGGIEALHAVGGSPWGRRIQDPLVFCIRFHGAFAGALYFFFERRLGRGVVAGTMPDVADDPEMQEDALSEMANIIAGRVSRFLESVHGALQFDPPETVLELDSIQRIPPICRIVTEVGNIEVTLRSD